jgi:hypothetical protein
MYQWGVETKDPARTQPYSGPEAGPSVGMAEYHRNIFPPSSEQAQNAKAQTRQ